MSIWNEGDLALSGINVHYYRTGRVDGPPVVLLHGFSDSGMGWTRLATELAPTCDVIALDAAGHGRSGGVEHGFRERAVSDVLGTIDALELDRPVLVGHSMGAATAAGVAVQASKRLRGVALEDPPWRDGTIGTLGATPEATGSRAPLRSPAWVAWIEELKTLDADALRAHGHRERPEWADVDREHWAVSKAQFDLDVLTNFTVAAYQQGWREQVRGIGCPTLLITGDVERGAIVTPDVAEEATRLNAHIRVVHVPGADHNIRRSQWDGFRAAVVPFVQQLLQT